MSNDLKSRIMRRVYGIWFLRRGLPLVFGSAVSLIVFQKAVADRFFVAQIFRNFEFVLRSNIWGLPRYIESALNSVEPSVLILISIAGLSGFALAVKLLRSVRAIVWGQGMAASYFIEK